MIRRWSSAIVRGRTDRASWLTIPRAVGIEFELVSFEPDLDLLARELPAPWGIGEEYRLGWFPNAAEFQSPPGFGAAHENNLREGLAVLARAGYRPAPFLGGTHCHVDLAGAGRARGLEQAVSDALPRLCEFVAPHRRDPTLIPRELVEAVALRASRDPADLIRERAADPPYMFKPREAAPVTVEFRLLEACMDAERVLQWAGMCAGVVEEALGPSDP